MIKLIMQTHELQSQRQNCEQRVYDHGTSWGHWDKASDLSSACEQAGNTDAMSSDSIHIKKMNCRSLCVFMFMGVKPCISMMNWSAGYYVLLLFYKEQAEIGSDVLMTMFYWCSF